MTVNNEEQLREEVYMREVITDVPFCRRKSVESRWSLWFKVKTLT